MCKQDTESVKVAPESVLSNRRESRRFTLDQVVSPGDLSPYTIQYKPYTYQSVLVCVWAQGQVRAVSSLCPVYFTVGPLATQSLSFTHWWSLLIDPHSLGVSRPVKSRSYRRSGQTEIGLYEGKADVVYLQVTLCDPHLSA